MTKCLVIGACGQLGTELTAGLRSKYGINNVIASDIHPPEGGVKDAPFEILDAMNFDALKSIVEMHQIDTIYHLAAILSAKGEQNPPLAWSLNMTSLLNVLNLAKENNSIKIFWPSSIAVFGPTTPRFDTPQKTIIEPNTVYGIGKLAGEMWNQYYHQKYGVDVRGVRYPGLIGWKSMPGGGTTDYAVDIFYSALRGEKYNCFLSETTALPMMHMEDAIRATRTIMEKPAEQVKLRTSYNISAMSFTPEEIAAEIKKHIPTFEIEYHPDFRQQIANSWPASINDAEARDH